MDAAAFQHRVVVDLRPPAVRDLLNPPVQIVAVEGVDFAQFAGGDHLPHLHVQRRRAQDQVRRQIRFAAVPRGLYRPQLGNRAGHGFLDEDVLAVIERVDHLPGMRVVVRRNRDEVDSGITEHVVDRSGRGATERRRQRLRASRVDVDDPSQLARRQRVVGAGMRLADAKADHGHTQRHRVPSFIANCANAVSLSASRRTRSSGVSTARL